MTRLRRLIHTFPRPFVAGCAAAIALFAVPAASLQAQTTYASNYTQVWTAGDTLSGLRTPGAGYTISMFSANGTNASNGQVMGKLFTADGLGCTSTKFHSQ